MKEIIIATNNDHKVKEFKNILYDYDVKSLKDVGLGNIDIVEDGISFEENALIKARTICDVIKKTVISDDSGLEIESLDNQPGIHSARFMGRDTPYIEKNSHIIDLLKNKDNRRARFVCSIAICYPDGKEQVFNGTFDGEISKEITGENGFGYDPIFYVPEYGMTAAQMSDELKNKVSHRAKATKKLLEYLKKEENYGA